MIYAFLQSTVRDETPAEFPYICRASTRHKSDQCFSGQKLPTRKSKQQRHTVKLRFRVCEKRLHPLKLSIDHQNSVTGLRGYRCQYYRLYSQFEWMSKHEISCIYGDTQKPNLIEEVVACICMSSLRNSNKIIRSVINGRQTDRQ